MFQILNMNKGLDPKPYEDSDPKPWSRFRAQILIRIKKPETLSKVWLSTPIRV